MSDPVIDANRAQEWRIFEEQMRQAELSRQQTKNLNEKEFLIGLALKEQTSVGVQTIQAVQQWQQTVNRRAENEHALQLGLEAPNTHVEDDWNSFVSDARQLDERRENNADRIFSIVGTSSVEES